jgi:hypothetical protein
MNKIYQIKLLDKDLLDNEVIEAFLFEVALTIDSEDSNYMGFSNEDDIFIRLDEYKCDKIVNVLSKYFIFTIEDVSDKALSGELKKLYPEVDKLTPKLFKNFRKENTTVDYILDKINEKGFESLDKIDLKILNKKALLKK